MVWSCMYFEGRTGSERLDMGTKWGERIIKKTVSWAEQLPEQNNVATSWNAECCRWRALGRQWVQFGDILDRRSLSEHGKLVVGYRRLELGRSRLEKCSWKSLSSSDRQRSPYIQENKENKGQRHGIAQHQEWRRKGRPPKSIKKRLTK